MAVTHTISGGLVHLSGNPIEIILTASAAKTNHRLAVKVQCGQLINPEQVDEREPIGLVSHHNIQGLVDEPLPIDFHFPVVGVATGHTALVLNVSLEIGEIWDDENGSRQEAYTIIADQLRVIDGKLRQHELAMLNEANKSFATEYINGGKFLTGLPNNQVVSLNQVVKLWYLSRWATDHAVTLITVINLNTKVGVMPIQQEIILYTITGLLELSLNPFLQGFVLDPGELITSFEVRLEDAIGEISERRTFVVDNTYYETQYFGYYRNKFSAVEHIWLKGKHTEGFKTEVETAYSALEVGAGTKKASIKTVTATGQRYWEMNTGVLSRTDMLALRDFLDSKERWIIDPDNTAVVIPVYVEGGEFILFDAKEDNIQNLTIKLIEAHV